MIAYLFGDLFVFWVWWLLGVSLLLLGWRFKRVCLPFGAAALMTGIVLVFAANLSWALQVILFIVFSIPALLFWGRSSASPSHIG